MIHVMSRGGVFLLNFGETFGGEVIGHANQRRPQSAVDERDLAPDEAADQHVGGFTYEAQGRIDFVALNVPPPTASNRFSSDHFGQPRYRALGRRQHDTVLLNEAERFFPVHVPPFRCALRRSLRQLAFQCPRSRPSPAESYERNQRLIAPQIVCRSSKFGLNYGSCLGGKAGDVAREHCAELLGTAVLVFFGVGVATLMVGFKLDGGSVTAPLVGGAFAALMYRIPYPTVETL